MTEKKTEGLRSYNETLNRVVRESMQTAFILLLKEKDFSTISVTDLCKKAGVSRMAFYNNYRTLDALLESSVAEYNKNLILHNIGSPFREYTNIDWYIKLFKIIKDNVEFLKIIFDAGFKYKYLSVVNRLVLHDQSISADKKYLRIIWAGGIVNTLIYWLDNDMKDSVEAVAKLCFDNMSVYLK